MRWNEATGVPKGTRVVSSRKDCDWQDLMVFGEGINNWQTLTCGQEWMGGRCRVGQKGGKSIRGGRFQNGALCRSGRESRLVNSVRSGSVARLHSVETKLVHSFGVATDELDVIGDGRSLAHGGGLEHSNEDHRTFRQHVFQGDVLAGEFVPIESRFLDKIDLVLIPAGDFYAKDICSGQKVRDLHSDLGSEESSLFATAERVSAKKRGRWRGPGQDSCTKAKEGCAVVSE